MYPTVKITLPLKDTEIQGVAVIRPEKFIICVPSQVGCPLQCRFCKAKMFQRNLRTEEIQDLINHLLCFNSEKKPVLLSFMGVGEPSLNLKTVLEVIERSGFQKFAISTCGMKTQIFNLDPKIKIQVSINAPNEEIRKQLMPNALSLGTVLRRARRLRNYDLNYILIKDINDKEPHAYSLAFLLKSFGFFRIKMNRYNETGSFSPSERTEEFKRILEEEGIEVEYYETDGREIEAACGQLI